LRDSKPKPLIGGIDANGAWTEGLPVDIDCSNTENSTPVTDYCYRVPGKNIKSYKE
jgi:hypothetical protein